jgi:hypothetical protein
MLDDIFGNPSGGTPAPDRFKRAASHVEGAYSILTGVAANKSIASGAPVNVKDLISL